MRVVIRNQLATVQTWNWLQEINFDKQNLKKKITYGILLTLLLVACYLGLRNMFGLFTPYNSFTAKQDIKKNKIQIIAIGLPYNAQVEQNLASKYGFQYNYIGCNATTELVNGTKYYNNEIEKHLQEKYGSDFWTTFQSQLDSAVKQPAKWNWKLLRYFQL